MYDQQYQKLSENQQKLCNHTFHYQVVHGLFQSDGLEHEWLRDFVKTQNVDYKLVYYLQKIYISGYTLSFQRFCQCSIIVK